jgi:hypothetical protein
MIVRDPQDLAVFLFSAERSHLRQRLLQIRL